MKKLSRKIVMAVCVLLCTGVIFRYGYTHFFNKDKNQSMEKSSSESLFYEKAKEQGIAHREAEQYWERLLADNIFQDGTMELTGLVIEDMDGNGQTDLLVMILSQEEKAFYGSGCVWLYMNEDEPYCFDEEDCSYYGYFDSFAEDIDNDGNVEIVLSAQGSGCGATGDFYKVIFKYRNHNIEIMELPSDLAEDYDKGIDVLVYQEPEANRYSAYCPYFKEMIYFNAENVFEPDEEAEWVGGNVRGFYDLRPVIYEGKNALQAAEYLNGEGGNVQNVAVARFIILWDENGKGYVDKWWIEENKNQYANNKGSRIVYENGYCYYASQLDNYYLYRAKEDGSDAVCLAKVHPGSIYVDGDSIYFVNLSDNKAIYRIGTDGSYMEKLCGSSDNNMQVSAEYIYFCDVYDSDADVRGLVSEFEKEDMGAFRNNFLYRMKKDGSEKELLMTEVDGYALASESGNDIMYDGNIYCGKYHWNEEKQQEETLVMRYDLDGKNEEKICCFDFYGDIMISGCRIYCYAIYGENAGKIKCYKTENKGMASLSGGRMKDYCMYKGELYGIKEKVNDENRQIEVYKLEDGKARWEKIYQNNTICTASNSYNRSGFLSDIYATEKGIFLRQFVSSEEGVKWFLLGEGEKTKKWEDEEQIPITRHASMMENTGDWISIKRGFESTAGYKEYLKEDITYEKYYEKDENGEEQNPYTIRLPQFNEKIEGYQEINAYFQNVYQEALVHQEEFFAMLDAEKEKGEYSTWYEGMYYDYVYIGEEYVTVAKYRYGYWGGTRSWNTEEPVTFDRKTGKIVTLGDIYGTSLEEAVSKVTASIYKYKESVGEGESFFLKYGDILTEKYNPEQFFIFSDGIGIYYERYAIDCGAAGDFLFIVPFPEE